jgi:hypothetical protein
MAGATTPHLSPRNERFCGDPRPQEPASSEDPPDDGCELLPPLIADRYEWCGSSPASACLAVPPRVVDVGAAGVVAVAAGGKVTT